MAANGKWESRLEGFHKLKKGWNSYDAPPPNGQSLVNAQEFLRFLLANEKEPTRLNPSAAGGVGFTFRRGERQVYVEFGNHGAALMACWTEGADVHIAKITQDADGFRTVLAQVNHIDED